MHVPQFVNDAFFSDSVFMCVVVPDTLLSEQRGCWWMDGPASCCWRTIRDWLTLHWQQTRIAFSVCTSVCVKLKAHAVQYSHFHACSYAFHCVVFCACSCLFLFSVPVSRRWDWWSVVDRASHTTFLHDHKHTAHLPCHHPQQEPYSKRQGTLRIMTGMTNCLWYGRGLHCLQYVAI